MSFIQDQINDQSSGSLYIPAVRRARLAEQVRRKENYIWDPAECKLYPSGLKSFNLDVEKYIKGLEAGPKEMLLPGINKTRRGKAIHAELQADFLASDRMCPPVCFPENERIQKKIVDGWPEIPFHDPESGCSGSIDSCMVFRGEIVPVEIKSTNTEYWHEFKKNRSSMSDSCKHTWDSYIVQLCVYHWHLRRTQYWNLPISDTGVLVLVNYEMDPGELDKCTFERQIKYSSYVDKTENLMQNVIAARSKYLKERNGS